MKGRQAQAAEEERGRLLENIKSVCFTELLLAGELSVLQELEILRSHGESLPRVIPTLHNPFPFSRGQKYRVCF